MMTGRTLDTLHIDILDRVLDDILSPHTYGWDKRWDQWQAEKAPVASLLPLSLVCKRFRRDLLPWIYRDVRFIPTRAGCFFPREVWGFIRIFRFYDILETFPKVGSEDFVQAEQEAYRFLPQLPCVDSIFLMTSIVTSDLLYAVTNVPRLKFLTLYSTSTTTDVYYRFGQLNGLHSLIFDEEHINVLVKIYEQGGRQTLGSQFARAIDTSASTLVHLDIPARFIDWEKMEKLFLKSLRTLVLKGPVPLPQLKAVLVSAPQLQVLNVQLAAIDNTNPWDQVTAPHDSQQKGKCCYMFMPHLRSMTIGGAYPCDDIFGHLPSELELLSFPVVDWSPGMGDELALSADAATLILRRCSAARLPELRLSIEGNLPPELFKLVAETFPSLKRLEVCQRPRSYTVTQEHSSESYITALAYLSHLREISFDWPMTNVKDPECIITVGGLIYTEAPPPAQMDEFAITLARKIPSLTTVRFRTPMSQQVEHLPWQTFSISRSGLENQPNISEIPNLQPHIAEKHRISGVRGKPPTYEELIRHRDVNTQ